MKLCVALALLTAVTGVAAAQATVSPAKTQAAKAVTRASFRTPWGDPDLQGIWTNTTTTPLE